MIFRYLYIPSSSSPPPLPLFVLPILLSPLPILFYFSNTLTSRFPLASSSLLFSVYRPLPLFLSSICSQSPFVFFSSSSPPSSYAFLFSLFFLQAFPFLSSYFFLSYSYLFSSSYASVNLTFCFYPFSRSFPPPVCFLHFFPPTFFRFKSFLPLLLFSLSIHPPSLPLPILCLISVYPGLSVYPLSPIPSPLFLPSIFFSPFFPSFFLPLLPFFPFLPSLPLTLTSLSPFLHPPLSLPFLPSPFSLSPSPPLALPPSSISLTPSPFPFTLPPLPSPHPPHPPSFTLTPPPTPFPSPLPLLSLPLIHPHPSSYTLPLTPDPPLPSPSSPSLPSFTLTPPPTPFPSPLPLLSLPLISPSFTPPLPSTPTQSLVPSMNHHEDW
ncbi:hypothetical protein C7M84_006100 [Penaeus vannamei]|uniref:Uncharacterized protein n=1 Tax=Penaeus vannamei TaxID=6689 RepID=A0A423TFZ0_PENVA|nr:hypothetical protein C7M84_006100 [Penaeus vannamei]